MTLIEDIKKLVDDVVAIKRKLRRNNSPEGVVEAKAMLSSLEKSLYYLQLVKGNGVEKKPMGVLESVNTTREQAGYPPVDEKGDPVGEAIDRMNESIEDVAKKFDKNKVRMDLLPGSAVEAVAHILTFGANRYGENNWQTLPNFVQRYTGAMLRHQFAIMQGEQYDADSGMLHSAHVACNAMFLVWFATKEMNLYKELETQEVS